LLYCYDILTVRAVKSELRLAFFVFIIRIKADILLLEERIQQLVVPIADELGVETLKVALAGGQRTRLVKVIVDCKGGVIADNLARISRGLALQMDVEDLIPGKYNLEVTTPGFEWPLQTPADFERYLGDWIQVIRECGPSVEGENLGLKDDIFSLRNEKGKVIEFCISDVAKVTRAVNWKAISRAGKNK